ncbi:MAG: hypothetical protein AAB678_02050 [Patescibacteria group bacterium]
MTDTENEQIIKPLEAGGLEATPPVLPSPEEEAGTEIKEGEAEPIKEPAEATPVAQETPQKRVPPPRRAIPLPAVRDELEVRIEKIMEDGLTDAYSRLSPIARQEFKLRGEQTANKIHELLQATKVKVKKIFQLLLEWLKMLPGVNHFFLEQEAKIKTDRIIALQKRP